MHCRTHISWWLMVPEDHAVWFDDRRFDAYVRALPLSLAHIPKEVLRQWICPLNRDLNSIRNYAWIDYFNSRFELETFSASFFIDKVSPNSYGQKLVNDLSQLRSYKSFSCVEEDKDYWKDMGTWKIPPIVLDVNSFRGHTTIPDYVDYPNDYVLVEGHHRLGHLRAAARIKDPNLQEYHYAYVLKYGNI